MRQVLFAIALLGCACCAPKTDPPILAGGDLPPVSVRVSPRVANPPLDRVRIEAVIPRHPDNRAWCIVVSGPELDSASCGGLDGDEAPAIVLRDVWALNKAGEYLIRVELYRTNPGPSKAFATAKASVLVGVQLAEAP